MDLCKEGLLAEGYKVSATDNIESVRKNIFSFKPGLVLYDTQFSLSKILNGYHRALKPMNEKA